MKGKNKSKANCQAIEEAKDVCFGCKPWRLYEHKPWFLIKPKLSWISRKQPQSKDQGGDHCHHCHRMTPSFLLKGFSSMGLSQLMNLKGNTYFVSHGHESPGNPEGNSLSWLACYHHLLYLLLYHTSMLLLPTCIVFGQSHTEKCPLVPSVNVTHQECTHDLLFASTLSHLEWES